MSTALSLQKTHSCLAAGVGFLCPDGDLMRHVAERTGRDAARRSAQELRLGKTVVSVQFTKASIS